VANFIIVFLAQLFILTTRYHSFNAYLVCFTHCQSTEGPFAAQNWPACSNRNV